MLFCLGRGAMLQFGALFNKNVREKITRNKRGFTINVFTPMLFILILVCLRLVIGNKAHSSVYFPAQPLPRISDMYWDGKRSGLFPTFDIYDWVKNGRTNLFLSCPIDDQNLLEVWTDFTTACEETKLAITTANDADAHTKQFAEDFEYWLFQKYPIVDNKKLSLFFDSEKDFEDHILAKDYTNKGDELIGGAVVFNTITENEFDYSLRFNSSFRLKNGIPLTNGNQKVDYNRGHSWYLGHYRASGFLSLQSEIDLFIAEKVKRATKSDVDLSHFGCDAAAEFPLRPSNNDGFWEKFSNFFGVFMVLAVVKPFSAMVKDLVGEVESKMRETLFIMNCKPRSYRWSWLCLYAVQMVITAWLMCAMSTVGLTTNSSAFVIFIVYLMFLIACTAFFYMISHFFGRTKTASLVSMIIFLASYFPGMQFASEMYSKDLRIITSILPASAITYTFNAIANLESGMIGARFDTFFDEGSGYSIGLGIGMLLFDTIFYILLGIYIEHMQSPGKSKCVSPIQMCKNFAKMIKSFLRKRKQRKGQSSLWVELADMSESEDEDYDDYHQEKSFFQNVPEEVRHQDTDRTNVRLKNLRREFNTNVGKKVAVKRLNLSFYKGQITSLLGHNGAGKTTTLSMLTGLISPTSGDAFIGTGSITKNMAELRKSIGVCPQINILYDTLSVKEHLNLYALIKDVPEERIDMEVKNIIADVGLVEKTNEASASLSGGQKRKLHLAIALIGNSKYIFLDEPTSGMDPYSRRFTWDVIRKYKKDRVIVLTTHFMDEAEILGDRIAIMSGGELKCVGSALFLKEIYGVGYTMTCVRKDQSADSEDIADLVRSFIPEAEIISDVGAELSLRLPLSSANVFEKMLTEVANKHRELDVGISVTTLEEVFLRIAKGTETVKLDDVKQTKRRASLLRQMSARGELSISSLGEEDSTIDTRNRTSISSTGTGTDSLDGGISFVNTTNPISGDGSDYHRLEDISAVVDDRDNGTIRGNAMTGETKERETNGFIKSSRIEEMSTFMVIYSHFKALWMKRLHIYMRDKRSWNLQILLPLAFLIVGIFILEATPDIHQPSLAINMDNMHFNEGHPMPFAYGETDLSDSFTDIWSKKSSHLNPLQPVKLPLSGKFPYRLDIPAIEKFMQVNGNFSQWLSHHWDDHEESRYLALYSTTDDGGYTVFSNSTSKHGGPLGINLFSNAFISKMAGEDIKITVRNHPMPMTDHLKAVKQSQNGMATSIVLIMAMSFVPASFIYFIVQERECKAKHQQLLAGVSGFAYWATTWLWDTLNSLVPVVLMVIVVSLFKLDSFTSSDESLKAFAIVVTVFGVAVAPFSYLLSWMFKNPSNAQSTMISFNFISGVALLLINYILFLLARPVQQILVFLFRLMPMFCLGEMLANIANIKLLRLLYGDSHMSYFALPICGWDLIYLTVLGLSYFIGTIYIERLTNKPASLNWLNRTPEVPMKYEPLDRDVEREKHRVQELDKFDKEKASIYIRGLRKVYPTLSGGSKVAVKDMNLSIPRGECFGLLGVNGAGKSTTMGCMTADFAPSKGEAFLGGIDILSDPQKARRAVGYCPQFDALFGKMTAYEHLLFYARLKGVHRSIRKKVINDMLKQMQLEEFRDKQSRNYSGGNKRKLSVAIAMIGDPSIVFLDEPSTGVDPVSRRFMWDVISRISAQSKKCSIVLTTHSMEECEALCQRIGIMVSGQLRCIGSAQHLKNRFGLGYQLELSLKPADTQATTKTINRITNIVKCRDNKLLKIVDTRRVTRKIGGEKLMHEIAEGRSGSSIFGSAMSTGVNLRVLSSWLILEQAVENTFTAVLETFPNSVLKERQGFTLRFEIPKNAMTLAQMFGKVSSLSKNLPIESYSLSQTTLEQIFNRFASEQDEETLNSSSASSLGHTSKYIDTDTEDDSESDSMAKIKLGPHGDEQRDQSVQVCLL